MVLPVRDQVRYWGIAAVLFLALLWLVGDVLVPFVLGGAIAYLLDPLADRLERIGFSRVWATAVISIIAVLGLLTLLLLVLPELVRQGGEALGLIGSLIESLPEQITSLEAWLRTRFPEFSMNETAIQDQLVALGQTVQGYAGAFVNTILTSALSLVNVVVLLVITPVVTIYLLLDWDRMVEGADNLLPRDHAPVVRHLASEIDRTLAAFLRGMGTVSLILGSYYAIALAVVGVPFGLVVGLFAGLITFIPYVGSLVGGALALGLALFQFWGDWVTIAVVAGIFVLGQVVEGNILTPKLVGGSVGLHPVWLLLALAVFGSLFGFIGLLVAVPVAAMIGVVARYFIAAYKSGRLYQGQAGERQLDGPDEPPASL